MQSIQLGGIDYAILIIYFVFVIGIGWALKRYMKGSTDFFLSGRSIPAWVTGLAFLSANLGAQEVIGMAASGAKYGVMTCHFYWLGAIPAMVFLAIFMMPFYYGSRARSVPEYLKLRFDEKTRGFNAMSFAVMTVFSSGISLHALAKLMEMLLGWDYNACIAVSAIIVLVYIFLGGLTSAIYNEVLQFFMIVLGFTPLVYLALRDAGGWTVLKEKLVTVATNHPDKFAPGTWSQSWAHMQNTAANPMGVEWFGMVMGLGFVLSFGYWCTDFLVVQRAMAANSMSAARRTPLIAAIPKMLFPLLVILPGIVAMGLHFSGQNSSFRIPVEPKHIVEKLAAERLNIPYETIKDLKPVQKDALDAEGKKIAEELKQTKSDSTLAAAARTTQTQLQMRYDKLDYNMVIPSLLQHYLPMGLLGLCLTALMASFMSGMAGNVTAFNTVWTYDIYQSYFAPNKSDHHYLWMGRMATIFGILLSVGAAYLASRFNNIMDMLQLVFGFVNAPLFATFLLGMFWRRATGHGAFWGLLSGTGWAAIFHGLALSKGAAVGIKGGWLAQMLGLQAIPIPFRSEMAQNFWMAIVAWTSCFVLTILISLATRRNKTDDELKGLVYSLTPRPKAEDEPWYKQPVTVGVLVLGATLILNIIFW
jgi:solute:Na+ symporter, SSS family